MNKFYNISMSVYSGFATRQQEKRYNECLEYALAILTKRVLRFYRGESCSDSKFVYLLTSIHDKMVQLEENKYLEPNFSHILSEFLKASSHLFPNPTQLTRAKEDDPFHETIYNPSDHHLKAKFNSLQVRADSEEDQEPERKHSRFTINERKANFKARVKTVAPHDKSNFFTPQKDSRLQYEPEVIKEKAERDSIFQVSRKAKQLPESSSKNRPISPTEFLRQTVKGESFAKVGPRARQKQERMVKI